MLARTPRSFRSLLKASTVALLALSSSTATATSTTNSCPLSKATTNPFMSTPAAAASTATTGTAGEATLCSEFVSRGVEKAVLSREQAEGKGARVRRSIGGGVVRNLDPFLMLDDFNLMAPAGFPDHPHRGMATVTYILPKTATNPATGTVLHEDSQGHKGEIGAGDVQWMTAGRGIVHAEMPGSLEGTARGLQLWVNLPAKDKMCAPEYQELTADKIPKAEANGVHVAVIAGEALGVSAAIFTKTPTHYLHYTLQPGARVQHRIPSHWNSLMYTLNGSGNVGPEGAAKKYEAYHSLVLSRDEGSDGVDVVAGDKGFEFVLLAGEPIGEPIVQYGPFVMNSMPEIEKAFADFRAARNGFEGADTFYSSIRDRFQ